MGYIEVKGHIGSLDKHSTTQIMASTFGFWETWIVWYQHLKPGESYPYIDRQSLDICQPLERTDVTGIHEPCCASALSYIIGYCVHSMCIAGREALDIIYLCHIGEWLDMYRTIYFRFALLRTELNFNEAFEGIFIHEGDTSPSAFRASKDKVNNMLTITYAGELLDDPNN